MSKIRYRIEKETLSSALRTLRNIGHTALLLLSVALILTGCPDDGGTNNNDDNDNGGDTPIDGGGTPTEATRVQNALHGTISIDSIVLNWDLPTDTVGLLGVTISEASNTASSLVPPVEVAAEITTYTVTDLEPATAYLFSIATRYSASGKNNSHTVDAMTVSATTVQNAVIDADATTPNSITLTWDNPQDTDGYSGVTITAEPSIPEVTVDETTTTATITGLTVGTSFVFTLTTQYSGGKSGSGTEIMAMTLANPIDIDGDTLIDINSLDQLHNIRYNLDGTSYKISDSDAGTLCGISAATACTGYELTQNLDFTTPEHYDSGMVNDSWRPQDSSGMVLPQSDAENATNAGWPLIGSCNGDSGDTERPSEACSDNNTPFSTIFEGNSFVISNLYARNIDTTKGDGIGLFSITDSSSIIRNLGIANGALYGSSSGSDNIGALVGYNNGTVTNSYVTDSTVDGSAGMGDFVGGLVGDNFGSITNSYATDSTVNGGAGRFDRVGGLVGINGGDIMASYADMNTTADGGTGDDDDVGGLVGRNEGMITAGSYASSTAKGGIGNDDVGGLAGDNSHTITDSYATGTADGGEGSDNVGGLVGFANSGGVSISNSYASGMVNGGAGAYSDNVGGLVGKTQSSTITASYYTTGTVSGGDGNDDVGGLVGDGAGIIASYASGRVNGGDGNDKVGGLVGDGSRITASYASATVNGQGGNDKVGGLVGEGSAITASYATGAVNGGNEDDKVGGLVGEQSDSTITASYAISNVDGGAGAADMAGSLVGDNTSGSIVASYGFGTSTNSEADGADGSADRPAAASVAAGMGRIGAASLLAPDENDMTNTAVGAAWNQASSSTLDAWHFGSTTELPALRYADYDDANAAYSCTAVSTGTTVIIPSTAPDGNGGTITVVCGETLLPGQQ